MGRRDPCITYFGREFDDEAADEDEREADCIEDLLSVIINVIGHVV